MIQSVPSCWSLRLSRAVKHVSSFLQFHYFFSTNVLHDLCFMCLLQFRHFHFNPFFHDSCSLHLIQVLQPFQIMQNRVISCHFGSCIGWFTWACLRLGWPKGWWFQTAVVISKFLYGGRPNFQAKPTQLSIVLVIHRLDLLAWYFNIYSLQLVKI